MIRANLPPFDNVDNNRNDLNYTLADGSCIVDPDSIRIVEVSKVNHPSHYNSGKIEVIDFIEDQKLGFHLGNAIKYICRAGKKDPKKTKEDLEKAIWYIHRYKETIGEKTAD